MYFEVFCILCILCILIYMCITFVYFSLLVSASQSLRTRARGWGVGTVSLEGIYVKWAWLLVLSGRHFTVNSDLVKNKRLGHQNRLVLRLSGLLGPPDLKSNMAYVHLLRIPSVRRCGRLCGPQTCAAALSWLVSSWPDWAATGLLQQLLWPPALAAVALPTLCYLLCKMSHFLSWLSSGVLGALVNPATL